MTTLAVIEPTTLVGEELRRLLSRRSELWSRTVLMTTDSEESGAVLELASAATLVQPYAADELAGIDLVVVCDGDPTRVRADAPPEATVLAIAGDALDESDQPLVAGVNLARLDRDRPLASPPPAVIQIALLLDALATLAPRSAVAVALQPVSFGGRGELDELFEQTRNLLTFQEEEMPTALLGAQLAFNLLPASGAAGGYGAAVREVLDREDLEISVEALRVPVFHGLGVALRLLLEKPADVESARELLAASAEIELVDDPSHLGPVATADRQRVLVGEVRADASRPEALWIWSVMDNLTRGAALNAVEILETLATGR